MAVPADQTSITGRVTSVNPKGLKLDGESDWRNFSRFASDIIPPMRGQTVTLTLDRQGFVRAVALADGSEVVQQRRAAPGATGAQRDRTISRLALIKAAAEFAASRPSLKSGDVMTIAASWERWVNRPDGDELTDAF